MTTELTPAHRTLDAVWRMESAHLIATLVRIVHDVGIAEELAHDALISALETWEESGVPDRPGAWLQTTAKRKAIDYWRRNKLKERSKEPLGREFETRQEANRNSAEEIFEEEIGDEVLRLVFMTCHPVLSTDARAALTLKLLGGLTNEEIARAFLVPEPTVAQRIVRAKRTLADERVPFEVPDRNEIGGRLASVLEVIYLIFNEGYSATSGDDWMRPELCEEALRLGRILAELVPDEPEVHGLVALMEIQASRSRARLGSSGDPVLLLDQNRALWDRLLIRRGLAALVRAESLGGTSGPYRIQAEIAACHARARTSEETEWGRIASLYDALARVSPNPVVELNRAVAIGMAFGPSEGLQAVEPLRDEPSMKGYHLLPSVRGEFLAKLGRFDEAAKEFHLAATLTRNSREKGLLLRRARDCRSRVFDEGVRFER